ncbi:MAG: thioredoxin family protein [Solirubrobacteraceae bacterium]
MADVTEDTFQRDVLDRSEDVAVVVDFWAAWCGPCRALGPVLEQAVKERPGAVELVKVDAEANRALTEYFGVHGIPAVKVFRRREVVAQFVGARPPARVASFLDDLDDPEIDALVAAGDEASLREATERDRRRSDPAVALAGLLHRRGESAEALEILKPVSGGFRADGLAARIRLEGVEDPDLAAGLAALDADDTARALDHLVAAQARAAESQADHEADVRRLVVSVLDGLGFGHPLVGDLRRRVAAPGRS